jgi:hypothetical protein
MRKAIVLDANLIVLLIVGLSNKKYLGKHKAITNTFLKGDFEVLEDAIQGSNGLIVTPHTLAEASNFLRQIANPIKSEVGRTYQAYIKKLQEVYVTSVAASSRPEFFRHGLADMSSLEALKSDSILLSTDGPLCHEARVAGKQAITFAQYRQEYYDALKEV